MTTTTATLVPGRTDALHTLGKEIPAGLSAAEAMAHARLAGWNVHKRPIETSSFLQGDDGPELVNPLAVPGFFATVRTNPRTEEFEPLGVVGRTYTPIQNEAHVELLDTIVDEGGARFSVANEMRGGRDVFMGIHLPNTITVGGVDPIDSYLVAFNSHDGSSAFRLAVTDIRVFCANQQSAVMKGALSSYTVRHTSGSKGILAKARQALEIAYKYNDAFELEAERMIQKTMTDAMFDDLVKGLFAEPKDTSSKATVTISENRRRTLDELFHDAPTNRNIRGTVWAGYQAITEYVDHFAPAVKGQYAKTDVEARAIRTLTGDNAATLKNNAFRISRELVLA